MSLFLIGMTLGMGIAGFMLLEDYRFQEALYMTIITLSTVGFTEVRPLSDVGRMFASFLIVTNISIFAYAVSTLSGFIIEGDFKNMMQDYRIYNKVDQLSQHIILCGYGRHGFVIAERFLEQGIPFVVIERKEERIAVLREQKKILFLVGDATDDDVLKEAEIDRAKSLITTTGDDAENVYIVLTARQLNPKLNIISRAINPRSESKLLRAGADHIIIPEKIGGLYIASLIGSPAAMEFFRIISMPEEDQPAHFLEICCAQISEQNHQKSIRELNIRKHTGAIVIGVKMPDGQYIVNPSPDIQLEPEMSLILLGEAEQMNRFRDMLYQRG